VNRLVRGQRGTGIDERRRRAGSHTSYAPKLRHPIDGGREIGRRSGRIHASANTSAPGSQTPSGHAKRLHIGDNVGTMPIAAQSLGHARIVHVAAHAKNATSAAEEGGADLSYISSSGSPCLNSLVLWLCRWKGGREIRRERAPHDRNKCLSAYFRVQMNTLEQLIVFIPSILLFAHYVEPRIAAALGLAVRDRAALVLSANTCAIRAREPQRSVFRSCRWSSS